MTSFEFAWNNSENKKSGKVFARKRKIVNKNDNPPKKIESKPPNLSSILDKSINNNNESSNLNESPPPDYPPKYIKRKQKKDKLSGKTVQNNNIQNQTLQSTKPSQYSSLFSVKHKNVHVDTRFSGKSIVEKVFSIGRKFSDLDLHRHLVSNLEKNSFVDLTNVQEKAIPEVTVGKNVLIRSQTGSGKTLAYAVPVINALQGVSPRLQRNEGVQVVIIVPTRELALQTHELFGKINTFQWIVVGHLCGGENRKTEKDRLRKGVHVLIATPGRLLDHVLHTLAFKLNNIKCLVLDEADRLLDMGFKRDIVRIVEELDKSKINAEYDPMALLKNKKISFDETIDQQNGKNNSPSLENPKLKKRQTILLSATLTQGVAELADFTMKEHVYIDAMDDSPKITVEHMIIPSTVKQEFLVTYVKHRLFTLSAVLIAKSRQNSKVFVFMATTQMVDYYYELFTRFLVKMPKNRGKLTSGNVVLLDDFDFDESEDDEETVLDIDFFKLHGSMDQKARKEVFTGFRNAKKGVLLCTDVVARGIDVPEADCIIQYTGPQSDDDYLHRVGRTGRAGKSGSALIFLTHEEQEYVTKLQKQRVYLKQNDPEDYSRYICDLMEEPDREKAATALQKRYEASVAKDKDLHALACFAYSSWSRFYNTYPAKMRSIFDFKSINLGHYVTSFALRETPSSVGKAVRGLVADVRPRRLNQKLATHSEDKPEKPFAQKRKISSISLTTCEFSSGLEPKKKKKKTTSK